MRLYVGNLPPSKANQDWPQKIKCKVVGATTGCLGTAGNAHYELLEETPSLFSERTEIPLHDFWKVIRELRARSNNVHIDYLVRPEQELPKLQRELASLRMEVLKLRRENTRLKQKCEKLERESEVNLRMVDEVIARRIGECFADEEERAIEAVLTIQSGVNTIIELRKQMELSCNDAIELFSRLGRADLVEVERGKVQLSPQGEEVAQRLLKLDEN